MYVGSTSQNSDAHFTKLSFANRGDSGYAINSYTLNTKVSHFCRIIYMYRRLLIQRAHIHSYQCLGLILIYFFVVSLCILWFSRLLFIIKSPAVLGSLCSLVTYYTIKRWTLSLPYTKHYLRSIAMKYSESNDVPSH